MDGQSHIGPREVPREIFKIRCRNSATRGTSKISAGGGVNAMRMAAAVAVIVFLLQPALYGQSSLMFAWLMDKGEMPNVRFVIINPANETAETTFTLYGAVGQVIATAKATIPGGGQLTEGAAQLFPQAPAGGWVQAKSDVDGL